ncbi:hypothetical protein JD844_002506 [Phrynosoma platyrhinos]|uniref:Leucine-rich repeat-containing protein 20 n=1 Tax=Phrynosoma platyrhinos TaxID=52577 RepID=A0ABQ7TC82_PHRPL|nr:hypothetical protein JD844_002506 [Phrynosoma platyrhinos]
MAADGAQLTEDDVRERVNLRHQNLADVRSLSLPGTYHEKITHLGNSLKNFIFLKSLDLSRNALTTLEYRVVQPSLTDLARQDELLVQIPANAEHFTPQLVHMETSSEGEIIDSPLAQHRRSATSVPSALGVKSPVRIPERAVVSHIISSLASSVTIDILQLTHPLHLGGLIPAGQIIIQLSVPTDQLLG